MCYKLKTVKPKKQEKRERTEKQSEKPADISHWYKPLGTIVKQSKSRELRASILYVNCDCEKRNGLQDDCQRMECHGSPECLTQPPTCGPSAFASGKHLEKKRERGEQAMRMRAAAKERNRDGGHSGGDGGSVRGAIRGGDGEDVHYCCFPLVNVSGDDAGVGAR